MIICTVIVMIVPASIEGNFGSGLFYTTLASAIIRNLEARFLPVSARLIPVTFFAPVETYVFVSVVVGAILSSPIIFYEGYKFLSPALYENEKRNAFHFVIPFLALFILGLTLGYLVIIPMTVRTLTTLTELLGLEPTFQFSEFFSLVALTLFLSGLLTTSPVFLMLGMRLGIIKAETLAKNRRLLYTGIIVMIAVVDPDHGHVTEIFLGVPVIVITELIIRLGKRDEIKKAGKAGALEPE
jgi:sec-independent protein translocase protein TatC